MSSRKVLANAIRALSMDGVQQANSGHPGAPMGMADIAEVLWRGHMNHNPQNPQWLIATVLYCQTATVQC
ncbi:transketolase [Photobacterium aphoticum]|uniref:Transketolase n=1 Tax=Photobacterium aphoticum TaxID=754436 RepID=A0A090R0Z7_9GAMM|nr:transketolase [Photobacterium aphoticum]